VACDARVGAVLVRAASVVVMQEDVLLTVGTAPQKGRVLGWLPVVEQVREPVRKASQPRENSASHDENGTPVTA